MINHFRGEYNWLSNFTKVTIEHKGITYPSVENFYMAMKTANVGAHKLIALMPPSKSKKFSREVIEPGGTIVGIDGKITLREDWHDIKLQVMEYGLEQKFSQEPFKSKLIATGNQNLVEGNYWNDTFWGVDLKQNPNIGENHLGRLIMRVRDLIK